MLKFLRLLPFVVSFGLLSSACSIQAVKGVPPPTAEPLQVSRVEPSPAPAHTPTAVVPSRTPTRAATATPLPTPTPFITPPPPGAPVSIPILMYHHLKTLAPNASETLRTWTVSPEQFTAQLDYLQTRGFHTITFRQLAEFFERGAPLPTQPLILTFDDAWIDAYTVAFPELRKRGMVGVFFVPTQYVDAGGELLMNWEQVLEMDRAGMEFGGHTISHADLTKTNLVEARRQLVQGKAITEEKLGHPIVALSYPFGAFNPQIVAEAGAAGYRAAVILCCGYKQQSDLLLMLPRIRISYGDTLDELAKRLPE
ncbi:MAG: polysaccharide deacetylase family protein [Chloroflexi bacterium]|nr:polysaccharide deacetylase family protein [Chloroflexota bacterium]